MVRTHFQELFRKLFGGGIADVMLEDEADVLERTAVLGSTCAAVVRAQFGPQADGNIRS